MADAKGEMHGCIVCGKLYQLYVVHDSEGKYIGSRVMTSGGREVSSYGRPLVACERHSAEEVAGAVERVYGKPRDNEED